MSLKTGGRTIGRRTFAAAASSTTVALLSRRARAQGWPARTLRIVVPVPPGGSTDIYARIIAANLSERFGQTVVVENRPSAGGIVGAGTVARAEADGYTLLACANSVLTVTPSIQKVDFDPLRDFAPVALIYESPLVFVGTNTFPPATIKELIDFAKAKPGEVNLAYPGNGTTNHVAAALFNHMAGVDIVPVPYAGNAGVVNALLRGDVHMAIDSIPTSGPLIRDGKVRALAVAGPRRVAMLPDVPTVAESGLPGYEAIFWNGVFAPPGTPQEIISRLNTEIQTILRQPGVIEQMRESGAEPGGGGPEVLARRLAADYETWGQVIRTSGVRNE